MDVRGIANLVRRRIGEPTFESVPRQYVYDAIASAQQTCANHARKSRHAWLTKTAEVSIDGVSDAPLPDDFGTIYDVFYNAALYPGERPGQVQTADYLNLDDYDSEWSGAVTSGRLAVVASRFDGDTLQNVLVARPRGHSAHVIVEYVPAEVESSPDSRALVIPAFARPLLVVMAALEVLPSAEWEGKDSESKRAGHLDPRNARNLSAEYERQWREYDRYVFNPYAKGNTYAARGFGWRRRGGIGV